VLHIRMLLVTIAKISKTHQIYQQESIAIFSQFQDWLIIFSISILAFPSANEIECAFRIVRIPLINEVVIEFFQKTEKIQHTGNSVRETETLNLV